MSNTADPADGPARRTAWIAGAIVLLGLLIRLLVAPSYGYLGMDADLIEQKQAVHRAITIGVHQVYTPNRVNDPALAGGEWQGGYFVNYPPLIVYLRLPPVLIYRQLAPAAFDLWDSELNYFELLHTDLDYRLAHSRGFTVALKLPGILADALIALGLFLVLSGPRGSPAGLLAAAFYAWNPGIIFNTAHWGQSDAVWVALLALSLYSMHRGWIEVGWVAYALSALTKPQAGAFLLLVLFLGLTRAPLRRVAVAAAAAVATALLVFLPFLLHGTFVQSVEAIFGSVFGGEPFVSCNANNLWWVLTGGRGYEVSDATAVLGPLTPRLFGMLAFLAGNGLVFWRLRRPGGDVSRVFLAAGFLWMVFFTFNTELHENHMMAALPLLAFAVTRDQRLWGLLGVLSVTFLLNLVLFDHAALAPVMRALGVESLDVRLLSVAAASLNVAAFGALAWIFWQRTEPD